jgi:large subunit ribosomal protein L35
LPYQCFQEARKILVADRLEKLKQIERERERITRLKEVDASTFPGGEAYKQRRLTSMQKRLEELKILADINDPNVKRRFEDGLGEQPHVRDELLRLIFTGDMNKPIYRHLAEQKWRSYKRKIQLQRITQMKVVPDVVPNCDPMLDVNMAFGRKIVASGEFVDSNISENAVRLRIQSFERGERLLTIAVVDPDVPNLQTDSFESRCHFLATNVRITPSSPQVNLSDLDQNQVLIPWSPPTAQKGSKYHRISIVIFQQKDNVPIDNDVALRHAHREGFSARALMSRHMLVPIAATLFRTQWDDHMYEVMTRHAVEGAGVELKRKKVEPLPYKRRNPYPTR